MFLAILLIYIVVVVLPVVFWFWFFQRQDRAEPEPKALLFKVFLGGIPVVALASIAEGVLEALFFPEISAKLSESPGSSLGDFIGSASDFFGFLAIYFLAGPVEEFMKFFILKRLVFKRIAFNQVADGLIYAVTIALSFSLIENSIYFSSILSEVSLSVDFLAIVIIRGVVTTMLHVLATAILGLYLGRAKFSNVNRTEIMYKGVLIAAMVHGVYNVAIFFSFGMLFNLALLAVCFHYIMRELKTEKSQMVWKLVVPGRNTKDEKMDV